VFHKVQFWVPQGSILVKREMMLYAGDTTISFASAEISTLFYVVTEDLYRNLA